MQDFLYMLILLAFALGWFLRSRSASGNPLLRLSSSTRAHYFQGLNYLINQEPDKAIATLSRLIEVDPDAIELQLALGALFRQRGELDRAIDLHQSLLSRRNLTPAHQHQALSALAHDYLSAGVLDRAERLFKELVSFKAQKKESLNALLLIYQQEKDWGKAISVAALLLKLGIPMRSVIAHCHCEQAVILLKKSNWAQSQVHLNKALRADPQSIRVALLTAKVHVKAGRYRDAMHCYQRVIARDVRYMREVVRPILLCAQHLSCLDDVMMGIQEQLRNRLSVRLGLVIYHELSQVLSEKVASDFFLGLFDQKMALPGIGEVLQLCLQHPGADSEKILIRFQATLSHWLAASAVYRCTHCGLDTKTLFWLCPGCHRWDAITPQHV